jgi:hypothetical protein
MYFTIVSTAEDRDRPASLLCAFVSGDPRRQWCIPASSNYAQDSPATLALQNGEVSYQHQTGFKHKLPANNSKLAPHSEFGPYICPATPVCGANPRNNTTGVRVARRECICGGGTDLVCLWRVVWVGGETPPPNKTANPTRKSTQGQDLTPHPLYDTHIILENSALRHNSIGYAIMKQCCLTWRTNKGKYQ